MWVETSRGMKAFLWGMSQVFSWGQSPPYRIRMYRSSLSQEIGYGVERLRSAFLQACDEIGSDRSVEWRLRQGAKLIRERDLKYPADIYAALGKVSPETMAEIDQRTKVIIREMNNREMAELEASLKPRIKIHRGKRPLVNA